MSTTDTVTLEQKGTPWAEQYPGNHRLTGRLADEPVYCQNGDVAPGWTWVGDQTEDEFWEEFVWQEHQDCHRPGWTDFNCPHCQKAGWVD